MSQKERKLPEWMSRNSAGDASEVALQGRDTTRSNHYLMSSKELEEAAKSFLKDNKKKSSVEESRGANKHAK